MLAYFVQQMDRGGLSMPFIITPEQAQQDLNGMRMRGNGSGGIFMG